MDLVPNLQTFAFIQMVENLFRNNRLSETEEEDTLLLLFHETDELLNCTFNYPNTVSIWNPYDENESAQETVNRRKNVMRHLDVAFHKLYRKLIDAFKQVNGIFREISPGIQNVYIYSLPSVKELVELYIKKSVKLQKSLYRDTYPEPDQPQPQPSFHVEQNIS